MLAIYLVAAIINVAIAAGFFFRHKQTQVKPYLHFSLAVLVMAISAAVMAFLGDMLFDTFIISLVIIYAASIVSSLAGLVMVLVVIGLIRTWIESMRGGQLVDAHKLEKSETVCRYLRLAYPALTAISIVFYVLLIVSLGFAAALVLVIGIVYFVCIVAQCAILVWMYLDMHNKGVTSDIEIRKRNQLLRLAGMTFFSGSPLFFSGLGAGIGGIASLWVFYIIALWPNALVGMEVSILSGGAPATGGYNPNAYGAGDKTGAYPAAGAYDRPAPQPPMQQGSYHQQPQQGYSQPTYHPDVPNYQQPQAAYQPQYQQQQGGQPQYGGYPQH